MQKFIFNNITEIFYHKAGNGLPVILLHGFGEDSSIWNKCAEVLEKKCLLIYPDLPGSGRSGVYLQEKNEVSIDDYAEIIYALLVSEKIDKCIMLGHSMGGYITLAFAKKYPERLMGFGLINSTAFADTESQQERRLKSIRMIERYGPHEFLRQILPPLFADKFRESNRELIAAYVEKGKTFTEAVLVQYYRAMMQRPDNTVVLQKSSVPVLFVCGTEDTAAPLEDLLKQIHMPDISYIHILENTGHKSMFEAPEKLTSFILDFIDGIEKLTAPE